MSRLRTKVCECGSRYNYTFGEPIPPFCPSCEQEFIDNLVKYDDPPSFGDFKGFLEEQGIRLLPQQERFAQNLFDTIEKQSLINKPRSSGKTFIYEKIGEYLKSK